MKKILILSVLIIAVLVSSGCVQQEWEEEKIGIKAGHVHVLGIRESIEDVRFKVYIEIESTAPLDIYFFPSKEDYEKFIEHKEFMHYAECYQLSVLSKSFECVIDSDDAIAILNDNSYDAIVTLRKRYEVL